MKLVHEKLRSGDFRVLERSLRPPAPIRLLGLQGDSGLRVSGGQVALIIVWKGRVSVHCTDGNFELGSRHWMLCHKDSIPMALSEGASAVVAVVDESLRASLALQHLSGFSMRGRLNLRGTRACRLVERASLHHPDSVADLLLAQAIENLIQTQPGVQRLLEQCPGRTTARRYQVLGRMMRAKTYLDGHPDRVVRVTDLSRLASFSPWHFTKTFRQLFGISPQAYGVRVRLERARMLVGAGELSIREIAAACGFDNSCSFARAFHEHVGCSATAMRGRLRSNRANAPLPLRHGARV